MKQVLTIVFAVFIFSLEISLANAAGIALTLFGGAWYTVIELENKKHRDMLARKDKDTLPTINQDIVQKSAAAEN